METPTQPAVNYGTPAPAPVAPVVSVKEWMLAILIMCIPIVNIIMMFVWAFGGGANPNKANYFKASLIWAAIILGIYILIFVLLIGVFTANMN